MKNRIMAILVVILMCFSMITPVFAATKAKTNPEWQQNIVNGNVYQIQYWHPAGYDKMIIQHVSGSSNTGTYTVLFYNDNTVFTDNTRMSIKSGTALFYSFAWKSWATKQDVVINNIHSMLFGNDTGAYRETWELVTCSNESYLWCGYESLGNFEYDSTDVTFEEIYVNWYYKEYGVYPPLAGLGGNEDVEFMKYPNYLILQQPIQITRGGMNEDGSLNFAKYGYVDTVDNIELETSDGTYVYVVVSSKETSVNLHNAGVFENLLPALQLLLTEKGNRNNYKWSEHQGYLMKDVNNEDVTRYYFSSLKEASKFVLYGTAGAQYQYKDETSYGYGYTDCVYNNYEVNYFGINPVPEWQYPLGKMKIVLRWHNKDVYDREYIMIDCNYFPYGVLIGTDYKLRIHKKLDPKFYQAWKIDEENTNTFDACDWSIYEQIDKYDENTLNKFQLYSPNLEEMYVSNSWDVIYSTHDIFSITKDGDNYSAGDISLTPTIEAFTHADGTEWIYNHLTDEYFKNGTEKEFIKQPDGTYVNEDGEVLNPNDLTAHRQGWLDSVREHSLAFGNVANIIDAFTTILDDATEQVKPITALLAAVFTDFPTIWKQIIKFTIFALILSRFIRRR